MAHSPRRHAVAACLAAWITAACACPGATQTRVLPVGDVSAAIAPVVPSAAAPSASGMTSASLAPRVGLGLSAALAAPIGAADAAISAAATDGDHVQAAASGAAGVAPVPLASPGLAAAEPAQDAGHPGAALATISPAVQASALPERVEAVAADGPLRAPSARMRTVLRDTIHFLFSSRSDDSPAPTNGAEASVRSVGTAKASGLSPSSVTETSRAPGAPPSPRAPSATSSKLSGVLRWAVPILAMTALVFGLDAATKLIAAKYLFTAFHEVAWRVPLIAAVVPYIAFTAYKTRASLLKTHKVLQWSPRKIRNGRLGFSRIELSGVEDMTEEHPFLRGAVRLYDVSIALMLGGLLGNGIDAFVKGGALDWIPLGHSLMNLADVALLLGLAFFQLAGHFFIQAAKAHRAREPLRFSLLWFLGLPLAGFFVAWTFGAAPAAASGPLSLMLKHVGFLYLMGLSMLVGFSRFLAALVVDRYARRFNAEHGLPKA